MQQKALHFSWSFYILQWLTRFRLIFFTFLLREAVYRLIGIFNNHSPHFILSLSNGIIPFWSKMEIIIIIKIIYAVQFRNFVAAVSLWSNLKAPYYQVLIYFGRHSLILKEEKKHLHLSKMPFHLKYKIQWMPLKDNHKTSAEQHSSISVSLRFQFNL